jgi:hypothetical protein
MSTPVSIANSSGPAAPAGGGTAVQATDDSKLSVAAKQKQQFNASVVQASLTVSLNSSNAPLSLVLKTALTGINEALKGQYGDDAVENAVSQDNTPEGTASRIVALSTAFYDAYQQQHTGEDPNTVLQGFLDTIQGGVDQGFKEARGILDGLNVLKGDIASNIDKTYDLVTQGYADFAAAQKAKLAAPATATATAAA